MSKHRNSLHESASARCRCGRYITLGEEHAGVNTINYECPDCFHRRYAKPLTSEEYYEQFSWDCIPGAKSIKDETTDSEV